MKLVSRQLHCLSYFILQPVTNTSQTLLCNITNSCCVSCELMCKYVFELRKKGWNNNQEALDRNDERLRQQETVRGFDRDVYENYAA